MNQSRPKIRRSRTLGIHVISVTGRSRGPPPFRLAATHAPEAVPVDLRADHTDLTARPLRLPERHEIPMVGDVRLVVEYHSRQGVRSNRPSAGDCGKAGIAVPVLVGEDTPRLRLMRRMMCRYGLMWAGPGEPRDGLGLTGAY